MLVEKKVAFYGYYGMDNFGDDLFVLTAVLAARKIWNQKSIYVIGPPIDGVDATYIYLPFLPKRYYNSYGFFGKLFRLLTLLYSGLIVDRLVFAGGSMFTSGRRNALDIFRAVFKNRVKISALGVSVGPFASDNDKEQVFKRLSYFDYIATRDEKSYERLIKSNKPFKKLVPSADLVGVLPSLIGKQPSRLRGEELRVGFSPCNILGNPQKTIQYCSIFIETIECLIERRERDFVVYLICLNNHLLMGDQDLITYVRERLEAIGVTVEVVDYQQTGLVETFSLIRELDFYVSVRLHGAISAFVQDTDFFLFEYHEKCTEFLRKIGAVYLEEKLIAAGDLARIIENRVENGLGRPSNSAYLKSSEDAFIQHVNLFREDG